MTFGAPEGSETDRQFALLTTPAGHPLSGATRYGAAMFFYQKGDLCAAILEIYRRCCKLDHEDPVDLILFEGIDIPSLLQTKSKAQS